MYYMYTIFNYNFSMGGLIFSANCVLVFHRSPLFCYRFGLYASPLEPDLFDIDPPQVTKPGQQASTTYATVVSSATPATCVGTSATTTATNGGAPEELDFRDLLSLLSTDKASQKSQMDQVARHICGLLEVEPLHFTCHATSDGTRMERMDTGTHILSVSCGH